jgi:1-phosphofructokinase
MIYTVTLNPSVDYVLNVDDFQPGILNRSMSEYKYPGGKGINVSRVLNNLGVQNTALGFCGGFTGNFICDSLKKEGILVNFITIKDDCRINVKIKSCEESEINAHGPAIDTQSLAQLIKQIEQIANGDCLVLAGNIQKSLPQDIYAQIQDKCHDKQIHIIVDTTDKSLLASLAKQPFLIKPNHHELGEIFNVTLNSIPEIIKYAHKLQDMGARNIIVSLAKDGALLIDAEQNVYHANAPDGILRNSVGAGDSLIGGFIADYTQNNDLTSAFKYGVAAGSATAFSMDLCTFSEVEKLLPQINIKKI